MLVEPRVAEARVVEREVLVSEALTASSAFSDCLASELEVHHRGICLLPCGLQGLFGA
jgi:hypothetical protein